MINRLNCPLSVYSASKSPKTVNGSVGQVKQVCVSSQECKLSREKVDGLLGGSCRGATSFPNKAVMSKKGVSQSVAPRPSEAQRGTSHLGVLILVRLRKSRKREIEGTPRKRGPTWRNGAVEGTASGQRLRHGQQSIFIIGLSINLDGPPTCLGRPSRDGASTGWAGLAGWLARAYQ